QLTGFFATPTPGFPNSSQGSGISPEVNFSSSSRTFITGSPLTLTLSTPGYASASIYYALGTNTPGTNTIRYTTPLTISTSMVLRARAFLPGELPGPVRTESFIALANTTNVVQFNSGLPVMILHNNGQGIVPSSKSEQYVFVQVFDTE